MTLRHAFNALVSALLAPACAACGRVLDAPLDSAVCPLCWTAIAPRAARFTVRGIARAEAIGLYEGTLRDVLHLLKYDGRRSIAPRLGQMMAMEGSAVLAGADLAVPVPLHPRRLRERGFNQAEDLARHLGLPVLCALRRIKATRPQIELPAEQRRENVRDAFAIRRPPDGCVVVLVDDVATTGATLESCARVLIAAGAAEVRALTAARVVTARH